MWANYSWRQANSVKLTAAIQTYIPFAVSVQYCTWFNLSNFLLWSCLLPYQPNILAYFTQHLQPLACFNKMWITVLYLVSHWEQINKTITANVRNWRRKFPPIFKIQAVTFVFSRYRMSSVIPEEMWWSRATRGQSAIINIFKTHRFQTRKAFITWNCLKNYFDGFHYKLWDK